jgi:hypothetical protein
MYLADTVHLSALQALQFLHTELSPRGTRVLCVLTQADMAEAAIAQSTVNIQASVLLQKMRHCVMRKAGLPLNQVTPLLLIFLTHLLVEFMSEGGCFVLHGAAHELVRCRFHILQCSCSYFVTQVFPSVNLVHTSEPFEDLAMCHLSLYVLLQALNAARHNTRNKNRGDGVLDTSCGHSEVHLPLQSPIPVQEDTIWNVPEGKKEIVCPKIQNSCILRGQLWNSLKKYFFCNSMKACHERVFLCLCLSPTKMLCCHWLNFSSIDSHHA